MTALPLSLSVQYAVAEPGLPRWRLRRWVAAAAQAVAPDPPFPFKAADFTLRLVDADEGLALNRQYRGQNHATNVLTFEYGPDAGGTAHGDIILCVPVLHDEARQQAKPLLAHAAHLTVHGVLHALGHDHVLPEQARVMEALEVRVLAQLRFANPYEPDSANQNGRAR